MATTFTNRTQFTTTLPFDAMVQSILGKTYTLSLVFIGERRAHALNKAHRNATYIPNVLSFPLDATHGEIYITPQIAKREAKKRGMTTGGYIGFLFIHGLLHLKGYQHGDTMERAEKKYIAQYHLH